MTDQEQIRFQNMQFKAEGSEYRKYNYKSTGMVIHWLYVYGLPNYDQAIIRHDCVMSFDKRIEYYWDDNLKMPIFIFASGEHTWMAENQEIFLKGISKKSSLNNQT